MLLVNIWLLTPIVAIHLILLADLNIKKSSINYHLSKNSSYKSLQQNT